MVTDPMPTLDAHSDARYCRPVKYSQPYRDAVALQRLIMQKAPEAAAKDVANLATSFTRLELLKLRIRMKPAPKAVDVDKPKKNATPVITLE